MFLALEDYLQTRIILLRGETGDNDQAEEVGSVPYQSAAKSLTTTS